MRALKQTRTEVRHRRALGLQHVLREIGALRARGYGRLQHVLAHIGLFTGRADKLTNFTAAAAVASTSTLGSRAPTISAHGDNILKSLLERTTTHIGTEAESDS